MANIAIYCPPNYNVTNFNLSDYFSTKANLFIMSDDYNAKHQSWGCRVTNLQGNFLYNFDNTKKYKICSPPGPTSARKKPDILDFLSQKYLTFYTYHHFFCY